MNKSVKLEGYLGGHYEDLGFFKDEADAARGISPNQRLDELLEDYKEKRVRITVEVLD